MTVSLERRKGAVKQVPIKESREGIFPVHIVLSQNEVEELMGTLAISGVVPSQKRAI